MTIAIIGGIVALIVIIGGILVGASISKKSEADLASAETKKAEASHKAAEAKLGTTQKIEEGRLARLESTDRGRLLTRSRTHFGDYERVEETFGAPSGELEVSRYVASLCKEGRRSADGSLTWGPGPDTYRAMAEYEAAKASGRTPATPSETGEKEAKGSGPTSFDINFRFIGVTPEDGKVTKKSPADAGAEKEKTGEEPADEDFE